MNSVDLVVVIIVSIGIGRGVSTGGIRQLLSLVGIVLAVLVAVRGTGSMSEQVSSLLGISNAFGLVVTFVTIFVFIQLAAYLLERILVSFLKTLNLNILNRVLGGFMGGFKALLFVSLLFFLMRFFGLPNEDTRDQSLFYESIYPILPATWEFVVGRVPNIPTEPDFG